MATSIAAAAAASTTAQLRFLTDAAHLLRQTAPETSAFLMHRRTDVLAQNISASSSSAATASNSIASSAQAALAFTQTDAQRQHVCTSCGHILIPGSNGTALTIQSGKPKAKKSAKRKRDTKDQKDNKSDNKTDSKDKDSVHTGITKVFRCGACSRETRIALPPPPPLPKNRRPKKAAAKEEPAPAETQKPSLSATPSTEHKAPARPQPSASAPAEAAPKSTNANSKKRAKNRKAGLLALLDKNKGNDSSGFGGLGLSFDDFRKR